MPFCLLPIALLATLSPWPLATTFPILLVSILWVNRSLLNQLENQLRQSPKQPCPTSLHQFNWLAPDNPPAGHRNIAVRLAVVFAVGTATVVFTPAAVILVFAFAFFSVFKPLTILAPPLSLWGRIRTGRLIIPAYDRMFWPALAALAIHASLLGFGIFFAPEESTTIIAVVANSIAVAIVLLAGPDRRTWALTAPGRMPTLPMPSKMTRHQKNIGQFQKI